MHILNHFELNHSENVPNWMQRADDYVSKSVQLGGTPNCCSLVKLQVCLDCCGGYHDVDTASGVACIQVAL